MIHMSIPRLLIVGLALIVFTLRPVQGSAQVPTNITPSGLGTLVAPNGNTFDITGGTRRGANLFHSFGLFDVGTGDVANFLNDSAAATNNILGRVNGGQTSSIFGTIRTTDFGPANLYLINPAGWIFGPTASLEVGGSFHVSTANYIRLNDGIRFNASGLNDALLTSAPPEAFGFFGSPASISVESISLTVPEGQTLSLVGGDVQITGANLSAPSGRVQIASVASAGEVTIPNLGVSSFASLGQIDISANSDGIPSVLSASDVSGIGGGSVIIRGGRLMVAQSAILADNFADVDGAPVAVDIQIAGDATLTDGTSISATASAAGRGGDIEIGVGGKLEMQNSSVVQTMTFGDGAAGNISAHSGTLVLTGLSKIRSDTFGFGAGGNLTVMVDDSAVISGHDAFGDASGVFSFTAGGNGGTVSFSADSLTIDDGGFIGSRSFADSPGGEVIVNVGGPLTLTGGGTIFSNTQSFGAGGNITVNADSALISGLSSDEFPSPSGVFTSSFDVGAAGNISLNVTGPITLTGGAVVQSGTQFDPQGGNITVTANSVTISDGSGISSQALIQDVGSVAVNANTLTIDHGYISTSTLEAGRAGDILLNIDTLKLMNGGQVATSSLNAPGNGGDLIVNASNSVSISGVSPTGSSVLPSPFGELINNDQAAAFSARRPPPAVAVRLMCPLPTSISKTAA